MRSKIDNNLLKIAKRVRRACEIFAMSEEARGFDFYQRNDLLCMCLFASSFLKKVAGEGGIKLNLRATPDHCFCEYKGVAIDITATQFYFKKKVCFNTLERHEINLQKVLGRDCKSKPLKSKTGWSKTQRLNKKGERKLWEIFNYKFRK